MQDSISPYPSAKTDLLSLTKKDLQDFVVTLGYPTYRADQVYQWLHHLHVSSYDEMANVPKALRQALSEAFCLSFPTIEDREQSSDGSVKYVLNFSDAQAETVALPSHYRLTVCFSTQAGCSMGCAFCATGHYGFSRNLSASEILNQLSVVERDLLSATPSPNIDTFGDNKAPRRITNAVAMGQGEPFLNYDALLSAIRSMNDPEEFGLGARKITVSTCGIIKGIERFSQEPEQFNLAVSLHSAIQSTRNFLMPALASQPLDKLKEALINYQALTHRRVTLEYTLIASINDDEQSLQALVDFCRGGLFHVNLLPLHPVDEVELKPSSTTVIDFWEEELNHQSIPASIRSSRGKDIHGACGQLANKK